MQIIEVTGDWIRSAMLTMKRRDTPLEFVLFPMLHVGSPRFYRAVRDEVGCCDVAVVEGIGRTLAGSVITATYRTARFWRRSGLVVQPLGPESFRIPTICPDLSGAEFERGWRRLPWLHRLATWLVVPPLTLITLVAGPRWLLSSQLSIDDEPTAADLDLAAFAPEMEELLVDGRDRRLLDALGDLHERRSTEPIKVAVVYGAAHLSAVVHGLSARYGYKVRTGQFLTVVDL